MIMRMDFAGNLVVAPIPCVVWDFFLEFLKYRFN